MGDNPNSSHGWRYFPLKKGAKTPAHTGWQVEATNDPAKITDWLESGHDLGIACGKDSNLFVVDVDSAAAHQQLSEIEKRAREIFPPTYTVHTSKDPDTGFQKYQLYFQHPTVPTPLHNAAKIKGGIDIRTEGGLAVAPDARSIRDHEYQAQNDLAPAELPKQLIWALEKLQEKKRQDATPTANTTPNKITEGSRNQTLTSRAGVLRSIGLEREAIEDALRALNPKLFDPPLPQSEVATIAASVSKYAPHEARAKANETLARKVFLVTSKSILEVENERGEWLWPNVVLYSELNLFVGDPDTGKTFVTINAIAHLTTGRPFPYSKKSFEPRKVLIFCHEDSYGGKWKPRLLVAGADLSKVIPVHGIGTSADDEDPLPLCLDQQPHLDVMKQTLIAEPEIAMLVIDPLSDFIGECDIYKPTVRQITRPLTKIARDTGVALLVIHHTNKRPAESAIKAAAGNQQLTAAVPNAWFFDENADVKGERFMLQIRNKADKNGDSSTESSVNLGLKHSSPTTRKRQSMDVALSSS